MISRLYWAVSALILSCGALLATAYFYPGPAQTPLINDASVLPKGGFNFATKAQGRPFVLGVLGTSLSNRRYDWPDALGAALSQCLSRPVAVQRFVKNGASSAWGKTQGAAVRAANPDLILVEFAINDADLRDGVRLEESQANHEKILQDLEGLKTVLLTMSPPQGFRGALRPRLGAYEASYPVLAAEYGAGFVDLGAHWTALPRDARGLERDGLHPAPDVARAVIVPVLEAYFCT